MRWIILLFISWPTLVLPAQDRHSLAVDGAALTLHIEPPASPVLTALILQWIRTSARAVASYYGRFPVPDVLITVHVDGNDARIDHGVTYRGRRIEISVGENAEADDFSRDWQLVHEMFHLALPALDDDYDWMGEGLSDYLEPIARVRLGQLPEAEVWRQLVEGLPKGMPAAGDKGLDADHRWGRMYWGGALFWLMADIQIREQTHNRRSIRDAARAILDAGGNGRAEWELDAVLKTGDHATGTHVLSDLHEKMGSRVYSPDLASLWEQLGVKGEDAGVVFDDSAPLAYIRKAITAR